MIRDQNSIHTWGTLAERYLHISGLSVPPPPGEQNRKGKERGGKKEKLSLDKHGEERDYPRKPVPDEPQDQFQMYGQVHTIAPAFSSRQVHRVLKACGILRNRPTWSPV